MVDQQDAKRAVDRVGRLGMVCYGVVHLLIGWLAAQVALGGRGSGQRADQKGAVETVAAQPLGGVLLWALAAGLAAFAIWQGWVALQGYRWVSDDGKRLRKRLAAGARVTVSILVAGYAVRLLVGAGGQGQDQQKELTARVLALPAGRLLVGAVGIGLIAAGVSRIVKGVRTKFVNNLDIGRLPQGARTLTVRLGQVGFPAKGVGIGIAGILVGLAAWHRNPNEAGGLDAALRTLAAQPFGTFLLLAVGLGFAAYGVYCFAAARVQRS